MNTSKSNLRNFALLAGTSLLAMAVAAGFSYGYVKGELIVADDADTTFRNILAAPDLFRGGVIGWRMIVLLDLLATWALWGFFRKVSPSVSLAVAGIRLAYTGVLITAVLKLTAILPLVESGDLTLAPQVMENLEGFENIWSLGLIIFGFHLIGLGWLAMQSGSVPKFFGILLYISGISYALIHTGKALLPEYENLWATLEMVLALPMALSEIGLALWMLIRGGSKQKLNGSAKN